MFATLVISTLLVIQFFIQSKSNQSMSAFEQVVNELYSLLPMFHRVGASAYKKDLTNTLALCKALGNPELDLRCIHVAGTNGKGSVCSMLAAVCQEAGYQKVGLYTSPHLRSFTERFRINGQPADENSIVEFYYQYGKKLIAEIKPSFFEFTTAFAFYYFAQADCDIAIIETGLGGRLDSTNVVQPLLSVITNIDFDHQDLLGNTLGEIAFEKAGIIKPHTPVVIGAKHPETQAVFESKANAQYAPLFFAEDYVQVCAQAHTTPLAPLIVEAYTRPFPTARFNHTFPSLQSELNGKYQIQNIQTVLASLIVLAGIDILPNIENKAYIYSAFANLKQLTGLRGRFEVLHTQPLIIIDVAHNPAGISALLTQISTLSYTKLKIVLGMVKDKDVSKVLALLPQDAEYYFCQANQPRALAAENLAQMAQAFNLSGKVFNTVSQALTQAKHEAESDDLILVTGSIFVIAEIV